MKVGDKTIFIEVNEGYVGKVVSRFRGEEYENYVVAKGHYEGKVGTEDGEGLVVAALRRDDALFGTEEECRRVCEAKNIEVTEVLHIRMTAKVERI